MSVSTAYTYSNHVAWIVGKKSWPWPCQDQGQDFSQGHGQGQGLRCQGQGQGFHLHEVFSRILETKARPRGQQDWHLLILWCVSQSPVRSVYGAIVLGRTWNTYRIIYVDEFISNNGPIVALNLKILTTLKTKNSKFRFTLNNGEIVSDDKKLET